MNSVKNAIVTMTLLAVGYGAYVVLNEPAPDEMGALAEVDQWAPPEVSAPGLDGTGGVDVTLPSEPESLGGTSSAGSSSSPGLDDLPDDFAPPAMDDAPHDAPLGPPDLSVPATNPTNPNTRDVAQGTSESYYTSQSNSEPQYPTTSAPEFPLNGPGAGSANASPSSANTQPGDEAFETDWKAVQSHLGRGELGLALELLSGWYNGQTLSTAQADRCQTLLDQLAGSVIYSRESYLDPAHEVQPGESLDQLAAQYGVPPEFLARVNGIEAPYELVPGEKLKVVRGPFRAEVDRHFGKITLFLGRNYAGRFDARIGHELPEGERTFEVVSIQAGREYFDNRTGARVTVDSAANPYGSKWIGLRGDQITAAHNVGIHVDTGHPTLCCIGVKEEDAMDLSAILAVGSRVTVQR